MHKTAITMPKETWETVQNVARQNGLTANAFMVQAVVKELNTYKFQKELTDKLGNPDVLASVVNQLGFADKFKETFESFNSDKNK